MLLKKPGWVSHGGHPLFSVDVHPDGRRFATGGQGGEGGSGRVAIWDLEVLLNEQKGKKGNANTKGLLTLMDHHLGCVNVVRFSSSGHRLASAGDDKIVMIWRPSAFGSGSSIFGSASLTHVESWRCEHTLRGHTGDILDLAWGLDDALLATASIDNSVIVWNALNLPHMVTRLSDHSGLVKGVAFDPVGNFLATQSDDKRLRVWRTKDWKLEKVISDPFVDTGPTTHVLRLHWSPEGSTLVSANADNCGGPVATIITRSNWKFERDFVGHKKAITCVKFSSNIYYKAAKKSSQSHFTRVAIGSRDRSISVWCTNRKRPWFVVTDLFDQSVLDLSWSRDGRILLACSMDGTVAAVILKDSDVGEIVDSNTFKLHMEKIYGESYKKDKVAQYAASSNKNGTSSKVVVIEDPELLLKQKDTKDRRATGGKDTVQKKSVIPAIRKAAIVRGPTDRQIEARTSDGKRRITPIFIPNDVHTAATTNSSTMNTSANLSNGFSHNNEVIVSDDILGCSNSSAVPPSDFGSSSTHEKSTIAIEKRDEVVTVTSTQRRTINIPIDQAATPTNLSKATVDNGRGQPGDDKEVEKMAKSTTTVLSTNKTQICENNQDKEDDGAKVIEVKRKRVAPIASSSSEDEEGPPSKQAVVEVCSKPKPTALLRRPCNKATKTTANTIATTTTTVVSSTVAPIPASASATKRFDSKVDSISQQNLTQSSITSRRATSIENNAYYSEIGATESQVIFSDEIVLPALRISPCVSGQPRSFHFPKQGVTIEVLNNYFNVNSNSTVHKFCLKKNDDQQEREPQCPEKTNLLLSSATSAIALDDHFMMITCMDATLHIFKHLKSLQRLCPPMKLPSLVAKMSLQNNKLVIVTSSAKFFMWQLDPKKDRATSMMRNECVQSLFQLENGGFDPRRIKISKLLFSPLGQPIIVTTQGKAFLYDSGLGLWMQLSASSDPLRLVSSYSSYIQSSDKDDGKGKREGTNLPLRRLCFPSDLDPPTQSVSTVPSEVRLMADVNHCELQMASASYLGSTNEQHYWLKAKVRHLVAAEQTEVLRHLLVSMSKDESSRSIMLELLDIVAQNLSMQRLYQEFKEVLQQDSSEFATLKDLV